MKYQYFTNGSNTIVCKSSFAGRTVRGVAKCNPEDIFDESFGKELAKARCDLKIAKKRYKYAKQMRAEAAYAKDQADHRWHEMSRYMMDAIGEVEDLRDKLTELGDMKHE